MKGTIMSTELTNAIARLEKASNKNARVTERLHEACADVADWISDQVPVGSQLPRGYCAKTVRSNVGQTTLLFCDTSEADDWGDSVEMCLNASGGYLHGDLNCPLPSRSREDCLHFANDIASGLIEEITAWLDERSAEGMSATKQLESAAL
jgi:hypothetical protein